MFILFIIQQKCWYLPLPINMILHGLKILGYYPSTVYLESQDLY